MKSDIIVWSVDGRGSIELSSPRLNRHNWFQCVATLNWDGEASAAEMEMITPYRHFWREYVQELACQIGGWDGDRVWQSEYGELDLIARNDGSGTVDLDVVLRQPPLWDNETRATLTLRADDVVRLARALPAFLQLAD